MLKGYALIFRFILILKPQSFIFILIPKIVPAAIKITVDMGVLSVPPKKIIYETKSFEDQTNSDKLV